MSTNSHNMSPLRDGKTPERARGSPLRMRLSSHRPSPPTSPMPERPAPMMKRYNAGVSNSQLRHACFNDRRVFMNLEDVSSIAASVLGITVTDSCISVSGRITLIDPTENGGEDADDSYVEFFVPDHEAFQTQGVSEPVMLKADRLRTTMPKARARSLLSFDPIYTVINA